MKSMLVVFVLIILVGCAGKAPDAFDYSCDDGTKFTVTFNKLQDNMTLTLDGKQRTLKHLISGSGTRYGDDEITYWGKGDTAMLIRGDKTVNCKVVAK